MIGAPIQRNRGWIVQDYLNHIYNLDYPKNEIHLAFFLNGTPLDDTGEYLFEFKSKFGDQYAWCDIWVMDDDGDDSDRKNRNYNHFAHVRNVWLSMRRASDTHIFSVDSDILLPPNILKNLLSNKLDVVAAPIINFDCPLGKQYNFLFKENEHTYSSGDELPNELTEVDATGACILIKKEVLDKGASFGYHYQGEDLSFCHSIQRLGYQLFIDPRITPKHYRERSDYENNG